MNILLFIVGFMLCGFILYSIFVFAVWRIICSEDICGFDVKLKRKGIIYDARSRPVYTPYNYQTYRYSGYSDHAVAVSVVDTFDDFLREKGIKIPCKDENEEAERTEDNDAALYGTEYSELVDEIENLLK